MTKVPADEVLPAGNDPFPRHGRAYPSHLAFLKGCAFQIVITGTSPVMTLERIKIAPSFPEQ